VEGFGGIGGFLRYKVEVELDKMNDFSHTGAEDAFDPDDDFI